MGKYAKYVNELRLWTELIRPSYRGKIADFSLIFDQKVFPEAKIWVETFHAYAPGSGVMIPGELPIIIEGREVPDDGGQHAHPDFDELFLFYGSNPHDVLALGGEVYEEGVADVHRCCDSNQIQKTSHFWNKEIGRVHPNSFVETPSKSPHKH